MVTSALSVMKRRVRRRVLCSAWVTCAVALLLTACDGHSSPRAAAVDANAPRSVEVRVPGALSVARGIDTLAVSIDPVSFASTVVTVDPGTTLGVETYVFVFTDRQSRPTQGRHGLASGADFALGTYRWNTRQDGLPPSDAKYVAEMDLVLFETDVPPTHLWDPHAGAFKPLWTRTLRQAEE